LKINSTKKAFLAGIVFGTLVFLVYVLFTCFICYLLNGENFVYKDKTRDVINGISFNAVMNIAVVISAAIPVLLIRYKNITHYIFSVFIAAVLYIVYFCGYLVCLPLIPMELVVKFPLNSFDAFIYGIFNFPLGAVIGILLNCLINFLINRKQ